MAFSKKEDQTPKNGEREKKNGTQVSPNLEKVGEVLLEELAHTPKAKSGSRQLFRGLAIPLLAIFSGLLLGGIIIILTTEEVYTTPGIGGKLAEAWKAISTAYWALFTGSFGDPGKIIKALASGEGVAIRRAFNPFFESLVASTPYIFAGLSVALGFRSGLFNIGGEGQLFAGAATAAFVGYSITGLPAFVHIPLALLAGALGGAAWGFIPGWLKAKTGGHEVINTIMMNYIAFRLSDWLLNGPMKRPNSFNPVSPTIQESAMLPQFFENPIRFHLGFFIALGVAWLVYWFLFKTRWGFELRMVGANPRAAHYSGIKTANATILAMTLAGALAGLAGTNEVLGLNHNLAMAFSSGYGFDAIALALLGKSHPAGVVLAALLFGTLRSGATRMQLAAGIPIDIISILQAMILMFIAAPAIIRTFYRLRSKVEDEGGLQARGWGV